QVQVRALARYHDMDFLPYQLAAGIDDVETQLGVRAERDADLAKMGIRAALCLEDDPGDFGAIGERDVADRRDQAGIVAGGQVALDDRRLGAGPEGCRKARM